MLRRVAGITDTSNDIMRGNISARIALRRNKRQRLTGFPLAGSNAGSYPGLDEGAATGVERCLPRPAHPDVAPPEPGDGSAPASEPWRVSGTARSAIAETDEIRVPCGALLRIAQDRSRYQAGGLTEVDLSEVLQTIAKPTRVGGRDQQKVIANGRQAASPQPGDTAATQTGPPMWQRTLKQHGPRRADRGFPLQGTLDGRP